MSTSMQSGVAAQTNMGHARSSLSTRKPLCTRKSSCICRAVPIQRRNLLFRSGLALIAAPILQFSLTGPSWAELDTATEKAGVGATIEGSDITDEDSKSVLTKLKEKLLPEAKDAISRVGKGEGSNYPDSIAKELETVELEINELINEAERGSNKGNVKSSASGIEQQLNALKAITGFD